MALGRKKAYEDNKLANFTSAGTRERNRFRGRTIFQYQAATCESRLVYGGKAFRHAGEEDQKSCGHLALRGQPAEGRRSEHGRKGKDVAAGHVVGLHAEFKTPGVHAVVGVIHPMLHPRIIAAAEKVPMSKRCSVLRAVMKACSRDGVIRQPMWFIVP